MNAAFDHDMVAAAGRRAVVRLDDGRTATLVRWGDARGKRSRRAGSGTRCRVLFPSGRAATIAKTAVAEVVTRPACPGPDGWVCGLTYCPTCRRLGAWSDG